MAEDRRAAPDPQSTSADPAECWMTCARGHRHWGALGAAGILFSTAGSGTSLLHLVVLRAAWVHEGGTWSIPGGALRPGESAEAGAHREAIEEIGPLPPYTVAAVEIDDCGGGWRFATVRARVTAPFAAQLSAEVDSVRWVSAREAGGLVLHSGFRRFIARHGLG